MRLFRAFVLLGFSSVCHITNAEEPACGTCTNSSPDPIIRVPPPWSLGATVYALPIPPVFPLPIKAYSPLERKSTATEGAYIGILGALLIIRYNETPVGTYDEFVIIPGYFKYPRTLEDGTVVIRETIRGSRFYVSQKYTNWNGRVSTYITFPHIPPALLIIKTGTSPSTLHNLTGPMAMMVPPQCQSTLSIQTTNLRKVRRLLCRSFP